jgi:aspartate carbamoyltransferase catalytic subunit
VLISPKELATPDYVKEEFLKDGQYLETESLEDAIPSLDILYMTRIQGERFENKADYERLKDSYILTRSKLDGAKPTLSVLHPLPRVNEIDVDVDEDPRAHYLDQARYGRYIRMALILKLLGTKGVSDNRAVGDACGELECTNPHCITSIERGIRKLFRDGKCIYCDQTAAKK